MKVNLIKYREVKENVVNNKNASKLYIGALGACANKILFRAFISLKYFSHIM